MWNTQLPKLNFVNSHNNESKYLPITIFALFSFLCFYFQCSEVVKLFVECFFIVPKIIIFQSSIDPMWLKLFFSAKSSFCRHFCVFQYKMIKKNILVVSVVWSWVTLSRWEHLNQTQFWASWQSFLLARQSTPWNVANRCNR